VGAFVQAASVVAGMAGELTPCRECGRDGSGPCALLWPTPMASDARMTRNSIATRHRIPPTGIHTGNTLTDAMTLLERGWCPCLCHR
jgi:hypothetical protein